MQAGPFKNFVSVPLHALINQINRVSAIDTRHPRGLLVCNKAACP